MYLHGIVTGLFVVLVTGWLYPPALTLRKNHRRSVQLLSGICGLFLLTASILMDSIFYASFCAICGFAALWNFLGPVCTPKRKAQKSIEKQCKKDESMF